MKIFKKWFVLGALLFSSLIGIFKQDAFANIGEAFGFGARVQSLGGVGVAGNAGSFAAYHNPAELGMPSDRRLSIGWGIILMEPSFRPINNVVVQNKFNADGDAYGDVDTHYKTTLGQQIGLSYKLLPTVGNLTIGAVAFLPLEQLAYMDTGEAYVPEYILYRARTQRPQVDIGTGFELSKGFHLGVGLHFGFTVTGSSTVFINTKANSTISSMRFTTSMKPKAAPYLGFLFTPPEDPKAYSLGAVFRLPVSSDSTLKLNSAARVFGDFAAVDFSFSSVSTFIYDPLTLELGGAYQHSSWGRVYGQVDWQRWSKFEPSALQIVQPQTTNCKDQTGTNCTGNATVQIAPGKVPAFNYKDIFVPRVGEEVALSDQATLRFGYAYRPSMIDGVPNGDGNFLDPPKHMLNLGLGLSYPEFLGYPIATRIDFNLAYHYLVLQQITKSIGNEGGDATDPKIGYPGYDAGGNMYGGGVSLSLAF
jgi:long-subunit fatty acid transport protein